MSDCSLGFAEGDKERLDKIYTDFYIGRDQDNPPVTTRLAILEAERATVNTVHIALFGDGKNEGLITKFERVIGLARGAIWAAGMAGTIALAVFVWALGEIVPAARVVLAEYYRSHPSAHHRSLAEPSGINDAKNTQHAFEPLPH